MTFEEALELQRKAGTKHRRNRHEESDLQIACIRWFRLKHRELSRVCFHVPNGGVREHRDASLLKREGVMPGVADILLLRGNGTYGYLCIELKTSTGRQSEPQKEFEKAVCENGGMYVIVRSLDEFMAVISGYLGEE